MAARKYDRKPDSNFFCIEFHGEMRRFGDIAREYGIEYSVMLCRYRQGDREDRLIRPKHPYHCKQNDVSYENEPVADPYEEEELYDMYKKNWHSLPKYMQLDLLAGFSGMKVCPHIHDLRESFKERYERENKKWEMLNIPSTSQTETVPL